MRASLSLRLFGLFLLVAVLAIAATAWLTTRQTGQRLGQEFVATLEADAFVQQQLLAYARANNSWDDVGPFVDQVAEETGQRVALTDPGGKVLADSASGDLPANPVAEIDVSTIEAAPVGDSATWRLTEEEFADRTNLVKQALACIRKVAPDTEVAISPDDVLLPRVMNGDAAGPHVTAEPEDDANASDAPGVPTAADRQLERQLQDCVPRELREPSAAAAKRDAAFAKERAACLKRNGLPADAKSPAHSSEQLVVESNAGATVVQPEPGEAELSPTDAAIARCDIAAMRTAVAPFLPEPALLYTGSSDRFDPLSDGGWQPTVLAGLVVLTFAAGVTLLAGRRLTRPIRALTLAARRMGDGDRDARVPVSGSDEVAQLGEAFNTMADSIDRGERQRKAIVTDIAHELRTPLANVRGYLEAAEDGVVPLDTDLVQSLSEESEHLHHLIEDLGTLALADAGELRMHPEQIDAADLARRVVASHQAAAAKAGITLSVEAKEPAAVEADPMRLRQALANLVGNAVRYTPSGGSVHVRVIEADAVVLEVADTGPGIAAEHLPHLFDRFYRAEKSRSRATGGSGLGLAITRQLVEANGGTVAVTSRQGVGSTFTIRIPTRSNPQPRSDPD